MTPAPSARFALVLPLLLLVGASEAVAQNAFSYQGQLLKNGAPPAGPCLVRFGLWDASASGSRLAVTGDQLVTLDDGLFTVPAVDFGFDAQDRWLELEVSCGDASFTTLSPRQRVGSTGSVPPGTVVAWSGRIVDIPSGWLLCDGRELARTGLYARLFAAVGTAHGSGNGSTTFRIPDMRGRFLRGVNNSTGRDPDVATRQPGAPGGFSGDSVGTLQNDEIRSHSHTVPIFLQGGVGDHAINGAAGFKANDATGATGGSETRPTNIYVNWLVKY